MLKTLAELARIKHWIKNIFVLIPAGFSLNVITGEQIREVALAFASFSLISSAVYVINDIADIKFDREHPYKKQRPLPSGRIDTSTAWLFAAFLVLAAISLGLAINLETLAVVVGYGLLYYLYSFFIKHWAILDVFIIATGFVLRLIAGGTSTGIELSNWILLAIFSVALLLAVGKRYSELIAENGSKSRKSLEKYSEDLLKAMLNVSASMTIITYALYTIDKSVQLNFGTDSMIFTVPFVALMVFRYLQIVYEPSKKYLEPIDIATNDIVMIGSGISWAIVTAFIIYG